jgi:hypothetical protein
MDGARNACLEDMAQHRGDDALATQLTNIQLVQATYRVNSTLLRQRLSKKLCQVQYCAVFVAVHLLGRTARLGPALATHQFANGRSRPKRARMQSEFGNT